VQALVRKGMRALEDVYRTIPERTFKRRLAAKAKLKLEEADAIGRLLRVDALAQWAFGDETMALDAGAREVEALLFRFVAGDYS
jgi:uncharacterized protein (DUF2384 family)